MKKQLIIGLILSISLYSTAFANNGGKKNPKGKAAVSKKTAATKSAKKGITVLSDTVVASAKSGDTQSIKTAFLTFLKPLPAALPTAFALTQGR